MKSVPTRVFALTSQEARESFEVVTGMIIISNFSTGVLYNSDASHYFMSKLFTDKLHLPLVSFNSDNRILLPSSDCTLANKIYTINLMIASRKLSFDLNLLPLTEFEVIFEID